MVQNPDVIVKEITKEVERMFTCKHPSSEIRYKTNSIGAKMYFIQCKTCGDSVSHQLKASDSRITGKETPYNKELQSIWYRLREEKRKELKEERLGVQYHRFVSPTIAEREVWWKWYNAYLRSPEWQSIRQKVLIRAKGMCEGCGERRAIQVHHLTYDRVGQEMMFDLVAVCIDCHSRIHDAPNPNRVPSNVNPNQKE